MKKLFLLSVWFLGIGTGGGLSAESLPDPEPVFKSAETARQDTVLKVENFSYNEFGERKGSIHELAAFTVGNKAVVVRKINGRNRPGQDKCVTIYIDNNQVGRFMWWAGFENGGFGYPFQDIKDDPETLVMDKAAQTVTYNKPYLTPDKQRSVFTYTIKPLKDSQVELSWDMGVTQEYLDKAPNDFNVSLWFTAQGYKGKKVVVGDTAFTEASREKLIESKGIKTPATGDFVYNSTDPLNGYTVKLDGLSGFITESIAVHKGEEDRYELLYRTQYNKRQAVGKVIIDLGEAVIARTDIPPPVGGIDFWKVDATHVPLSPVKNVMPNPSFEQGMRYWKWVHGGATYTPGEVLHYDIVPEGVFGKNALIIRDTQPGAPALMSFPLSLENNQVYTLSFYAKAARNCNLTVSLASAARGGKFVGKNGPWGDTHNPEAKFSLTTEWERYSRTFTADAAGVQLGVYGANETMIDGIQLEKGEEATEFVSAPLDGLFTTSDPDNALVKGIPIEAGFTLTGKPSVKGEVVVSVKNVFREIVYAGTFQTEIPADGMRKISLPFDAEKFGEGIFVVKAEYKVPGLAPYYDYYRLSIMKPLGNTHATKNIFGTLGHYARINRGEDLARKYMEWGFGSTSWSYHPKHEPIKAVLEKKYRIANIATMVTNQGDPLLSDYLKWETIPPEMEQHIEQVACESAKQYDPEWYNIWGFGNEEEGSYLIRNKMFDEYFKAQLAAAKGVKRANPNAIIIPSCGTSGYSVMRGYDAIEGYLKAAQNHGFRYDAMAVHPYGNIDKGTLSKNDLDEETARLIEQMKRYGYGKETPIYYTEMFNVPETYLPAWAADATYDQYAAGKPTYDFGNREFIQAASASRAFVIMLKYWPQVQSSNIWVSRPFLDMYLTPIILCKAVNTLGTHLGYVEYQADVRPAAGIRGYVFKLEDGSGVAPVWCVNHDVENGLARGSKIEVKFGQSVEFIDLMGNRRVAEPNAEGITEIQLTPAPLLVKAADVALLAKALQDAESNDSSSSVTVAMRPTLDGNVCAVIKNLTGRVQRGVLTVTDKQCAYELQPDAQQVITIADSNQGNQFSKMYKWEHQFEIEPAKGVGLKSEWKMDYFYVPKTNGAPDWDKIPAIPLLNRFTSQYTRRREGQDHDRTIPEAGYPGDLDAVFKLAWDSENLYLRVEAEDDKFLEFSELWKVGGSDRMLYVHDGCLEVYFDTGADGRTNLAKTYDNNDYRYDFSLGKSNESGPGMVYRLREVYHQLADGVNMATKEEAAAKIKCDFQRTEKGYAYTITFGQRYLEPIVLRKGFTAGFALFLHDRDDPEIPSGVKGLSLATEPGSHCDYKPHVWPLLILAE
jgi:hypothetical protein